MKKLIIPLLISALVLTSCFNKKNISVAIVENQDKLELTAKYKPSKTYAVERFIKSQLESTQAFNNTGNTGVIAVLNDNTKVYIKSSKGKLNINLSKQENSEASYYRVKKMCEEVKDIITD